ncbi:MAG TPA: DinB family protein [Actinomycetota bacterium]|nr:DinB family protein [Actinomycetota bacterium]
MADTVDHVAENDRERDRMRRLIERLEEEQLRASVNEYWNVAGVLGHIAFWDARVLSLIGKLERGVPFSPTDTEPEDVDWINDASRPLIHAIAPEASVHLALQIAENTDAAVAALPRERMHPFDPESPIYAVRASHRGEHLDEIEAALGLDDR